MNRTIGKLLSIGRFATAIVVIAGTASGIRSAPAAVPHELSAALEDFRTIQPQSEGQPVRERTLQAGHLELYFREGSLFPLRSRGGELLGWFFSGDGRYFYRTEDAADRKALEVNLSRKAVAPRYQDGTVIDSFKRLLIFSPSLTLQDLSKEEAGGPSTVATQVGPARTLDAANRAAFQEIWEGIGRTSLPYDHLAAEARLNGGGSRYLLIETRGGTKPAGYELDGIRESAERLFFLEDLPEARLRVRQPLSRQSLDGGEGTGAQGVVLKDIQISLRTEDNRTATIASDLTCQVQKDGLKVVALALLNNKNTYSADWNSPRNQLRVLSVTDETGRRLTYSHRYHEILIELPRAFSSGEFVNLRFQTEGEILTGMAGREKDNYFELLGVSWYPQPDFWTGSGFTFSLKIRTRKPLRPVAVGSTTSFKAEGDFYELTTESLRPARWLAVLAGKYVSGEEKFGRLTVRAHAYAMARQNVLELMPRLAANLVSFYEQQLGAYHSDELEIVEVPYIAEEGNMAFGIATPGLVLMTGEAYHARGRSQTEYFSRGVNARLAHEIAHQWFGVTAVPLRREDVWLSESVAEYLSGLAMGASQAEAKGVVGFKEMFAGWRSDAQGCRNSASLESAGELLGDEGWMDRTCLLYNRGPLVLHMLRTMAGNDQFFAVLRRYLAAARAGNATTQDFQAAVEEVLQQDMGWFFDSWYRKGGIPEIQVGHRIEREPGKSILVARAVQGAGPEFKKILVPLVLEYAGGRREVKLLFQDNPITEARFEIENAPVNVLIDPGQNNLAVYRPAP